MNPFFPTVYLPKTIGLFELSDPSFTYDLNIRSTFEYYWKNYNKDFKAFPIFDTYGDPSKTIEYLNKYYQMGYRYFVGFSRSTILFHVLDWFESHPDAIGFSLYSTAINLHIPKNIFRLSPNDHIILTSILSSLQQSNKLYYIYNQNELAQTQLLHYLQQLEFADLRVYAVTSDNLKVDDLGEFLIDSESTDVILVYLTNTQDYINLYSEGLTFEGNQYDISNSSYAMDSYMGYELANKWYRIQSVPMQTSLLWRKAYETLGENYHSKVSLQTLHLLQNLIDMESIENVGTHGGLIQFDTVFKDIIYGTIFIQKYDGYSYQNISMYVEDPKIGNFEMVVV